MKAKSDPNGGGEETGGTHAPLSAGSPHEIHLRRILLPTDFSDASKQAFQLAVPLAKQFGAQITLVHVVPAVLPVDVTSLAAALPAEDLARQASENLERFRQAELPENLSVVTRVLMGGAAHELTRFAKTAEIDLIVVSTHGYTGLKHFLMGSTAERIVRHAPCPVLVARASGQDSPGPVGFDLRRLLVPTDFSSNAVKAFTYALTLAREFEASVSLLHVVPLPTVPEYGYAKVAIKAANSRQEAHEQLERMRNEAGDSASLVESLQIRTGNPFQEIVDEAKEKAADLIIVSTHGHSGIAHFLLGSTAEKIIRHAPCPVLVVRERERDFISDEQA